MKKGILLALTCSILLLPLWLVIFVGYPILFTDLARKHEYPGASNRCFTLGDSHSLMHCFKSAVPKVRLSFLFVYFHEFRYLFVISGMLVVLATYCGAWLVLREDELV